MASLLLPEGFKLAPNCFLLSAEKVDDKYTGRGQVSKIPPIGSPDYGILITKSQNPWVVFNTEGGLEVAMDGEEYLLVHASSILGLLPAPE